MDDEQQDDEQEGGVGEDEGGGTGPKIHAPLIIAGFITFGIFDVLGLIPFVSNILSVGWGVFTVVSAITGIGGAFVTAVNALAFLLENVPVVQALQGRFQGEMQVRSEEYT